MAIAHNRFAASTLGEALSLEPKTILRRAMGSFAVAYGLSNEHLDVAALAYAAELHPQTAIYHALNGLATMHRLPRLIWNRRNNALNGLPLR